MSESNPRIRLTQTVQKGGCAAKLPAGMLSRFLSQLTRSKPSEKFLLGYETLDDACLYDLEDGRVLIQTLDFFTPIVDDPKDFGAIAAANALSDVYAMGGLPATALSILAFPTETLPLETLTLLFQGALETIEEAGAQLVGGHSIDDSTLKLGFSVSGFAKKSNVWLNSGVSPGDRLILTKGLGTGTITSALKVGDAPADWIASAIQSMKTLNRVPEFVQEFDIHAATDVTGFGLAGHALQMAKASRVQLVFDVTNIPALLGAKESIAEENLNRAHQSNADYVKNQVAYTDEVASHDRWLTLDPQTSGGLLLSVAPKDAAVIFEKIKIHFPQANLIGEARELNQASTSEQVIFQSLS